MGQFLGKPDSLSGTKNLPPLLLETQLFSICKSIYLRL